MKKEIYHGGHHEVMKIETRKIKYLDAYGNPIYKENNIPNF